jgi:uncharacterized protein YndB with AHSA1/START domain
VSSIVKDVTVPAAPDAVFDAFTSSAGLMSFFAPFAIVEPVVGGRYHLDFTVTGADDGEEPDDDTVCRIQALEPGRLVVSFANPPLGPRPIPHKTLTIIVSPDCDHGVDGARVRIEHGPFSDAEALLERWWVRAWATILARLVKRWKSGPIAWA